MQIIHLHVKNVKLTFPEQSVILNIIPPNPQRNLSLSQLPTQIPSVIQPRNQTQPQNLSHNRFGHPRPEWHKKAPLHLQWHNAQLQVRQRRGQP